MEPAMKSQIKGNSLYSVYSASAPSPMTMKSQAYQGLMDDSSLYSEYSPPRSSSDRQTYNSIYSDYSPDLSVNNYDTLPTLSQQDVALLAEQLASARISDGYSRVPSSNGRDYYKNQESLPAPASRTVRDLDLYGSGILDYPYESSLYGSYGRNHDHDQSGVFDMQRNPSFGGSNVPVNPYERKLSTSNYGIHGRTSYGFEVEADHHGDMQRNPRYPKRQEDYVYSGRNSMVTTTRQVNQKEGRDSVSFISLMRDTIRAGDVFELMKDKHGNYTFQNFLKLCDEGQMEEIVIRVSEDPKRLIQVATHPIGRMSFKKLIAAVTTSPQLCDHLMTALSPQLYDLMTVHYGAPVIETLLCNLGPDHNSLIFKVALEHFSSLSRHQRGVISLNHCFNKLFKLDGEETDAAKIYRTRLWMNVMKNCVELATDNYGNYVVQNLVKLGIRDLSSLICNKLKDHVQVLSQSRSGSYVMETCLNSSSGDVILEALVTCKPQILHEITMHPFGNYVMQVAMKVLKDKPLHQKLVKAIKGLPEDFKYHINARNVLNRA